MLTALRRRLIQALGGQVRHSSENPAYPITDYDVYPYGGRTAAGVNVSISKALGYAPFWRAVNLLSFSVGKLPFVTYRVDGQNRERLRRDPRYRLLRYRPNRYENAEKFWRKAMARVLLWGNVYIWLPRDRTGQVTELIQLDPASTYPEWNRDGSAELVYITSDSQGGQVAVSPEDVMHIRSLHDDSQNGFVGLSVVRAMAEDIGLGVAGRDYGARYLRAGGKPHTAITVPTHMSDKAIEGIKKTWPRGQGNHIPLILREGMQLETFSLSNEDAQFLQLRQFQDVTAVSNATGVPPHKLGSEQKAAYNSLESENQAFLDDSLDPWLVAFEMEAMEKLRTDRERDDDSVQFQFLRQALLRSDLSTRGEYYTKALQQGWMSRDEVRALEDLNEIPDGQGKTYLVPVNMTTLEDINEPDEEPPEVPPAPPVGPAPEEDVDESARVAAILDVLNRSWTALQTRAVRRAKKPGEYLDYVEKECEGDYRATFVRRAGPIVDVLNGRPVYDLADRFFDLARRCLDAAADVGAEELPDEVKRSMKSGRAELPAVALWYLETDDGTGTPV